jgi:colanic acid/amylovoran biosynthesis glycosyltransferase
MNKRKFNIILITNEFPFGKGESFLINELPYLSEFFESVFVIPFKMRRGSLETGERMTLPSNFRVILPEKKYIIETQVPSLTNLPELISLLIRIGREEFSTLKGALSFLKPKNFIVTLIRLNRALEYEKEINHIIKNNNLTDFLIYSYWVDSWLIGAIRVREKLKRKFRIVSRAHRGDLYHEAGIIGYQPHRKFIWRNIDFLFPISLMGYNYLLNHYKELQGKMKTFYLGVEDRKRLSPYEKKNSFNLLSCSNLIKVKRVDLILKALKLLSQKHDICWIHLGDGPLGNELKKESENLPDHITPKFKGHLPNEDVISFYLENQVDLFINVSESEGIPVSIMEVISLGIPVAATNVGGVSEIITNDFGYLMPKDLSPGKLAETIESHLCKPETEIIEMRKKAREFYLKNFNAGINYKEFIRELEQIYYLEPQEA